MRLKAVENNYSDVINRHAESSAYESEVVMDAMQQVESIVKGSGYFIDQPSWEAHNFYIEKYTEKRQRYRLVGAAYIPSRIVRKVNYKLVSKHLGYWSISKETFTKLSSVLEVQISTLLSGYRTLNF